MPITLAGISGSHSSKKYGHSYYGTTSEDYPQLGNRLTVFSVHETSVTLDHRKVNVPSARIELAHTV